MEQAGIDIPQQKQTSHTQPIAIEGDSKNPYRTYPELAESAKKPIRLRLFLRIGAVAACLLICLVGWMIFSHLSKSQISPSNSSIGRVAEAVQPSIKIENISENSRVLIASGQQIVSSDQLVTLLINEKHCLIMNENTALSIKPLSENEHIGCAVNLASGRIYVHVEHDGNPFVVNTANGKAIITGTTFDINASSNKTTLVVAEGNVKFTSELGSVNVSGGYSSEAFDKSAPIQPTLCDVKQLTAWATDYELKSTLAKIEAYTDSFDISDLWLTAYSGPIDPEKIDYEEWIEKKRDWFEQEFPQIFRLKEALAKENIETDYPEILFTSNCLWQFISPEASNKQFSILTSDSILKVASTYDFEEQWLLKNLPSVKSLNNNLADMKGIFIGQDAFQKWIEQFKQTRKSQNSIDSSLLVYSLHASTYLTNTRTLIWLYIANEKTELTPESKADLSALLQNEVNEAEKIKEYILRLFTISENCPCEEFNILIDKAIKSITVIMELEERVSQYEISK